VCDRNANPPPAESIRAAEIVLPCAELQATLDFFVERLGFRLDRISPADDPRTALISGHGVRIVLRRASGGPPASAPELAAPPDGRELVVARAGNDDDWITGRAGMRYRDLIPGRLGGRCIASRIRIRDGGPVRDQVHFHAVRFQMIYCAKGWVRVVYEDQGPPFVLAAGDCVLQPPLVRHRVLESSPGMEVVEISCPAEHETLFDHELELPTSDLRPERAFDGQRFVRHVAGTATWRASRSRGFEHRDLGIAKATGGLAGARVIRKTGSGPSSTTWSHDGELLFAHVLAGSLGIERGGTDPLHLLAGDSLVVPAGLECTLVSRTDDLEFLEVRLPGEA
jgi:quercetin dioxygenase-like cupin family protein